MLASLDKVVKNLACDAGDHAGYGIPGRSQFFRVSQECVWFLATRSKEHRDGQERCSSCWRVYRLDFLKLWFTF